MNCITFKKEIRDYFDDALENEELDDFLQHFKTCPSCAEELEINFIAEEGLKILDTESSNFDLSGAFETNTHKNFLKLKFRKNMIRLSYIADSVLIWVMFAVIFAFFKTIITQV